MNVVNYKDKTYSVDSHDFLIDFFNWDEDFAEWTAVQLGMPPKLTEEHWDVIYYIRLEFQENGKCPTVYETCRMCKLGLNVLLRLFPSGYLRGACRIAGVTYKQGYLSQNFMPMTEKDYDVIATEKVYQVDVRGFLINPDEWDEFYAAHRAADMKIPGGRLSERHWQIINYLREMHASKKWVPTVYKTCQDNEIDLNELERLFPDGYHRGAVKIAGLRII